MTGTPPAAHHGPDGSFRNPWPDSSPHSGPDVLRFMGERRTQTLVRTPPRGSFTGSTPAVSYPRAGDTEFTATWIGHSTVLLQFGGLNVLTDPVFSQRAFPVQWMGPRRVMDPALPIHELPAPELFALRTWVLRLALASHYGDDSAGKGAVLQKVIKQVGGRSADIAEPADPEWLPGRYAGYSQALKPIEVDGKELGRVITNTVGRQFARNFSSDLIEVRSLGTREFSTAFDRLRALVLAYRQLPG